MFESSAEKQRAYKQIKKESSPAVSSPYSFSVLASHEDPTAFI